MKILVCISKTPDTTTKIAFTDNNTKFNSDKVQYIINPYDEWFALVRALELKETKGGTVTVINVGAADNDVIIRKALALGVDDAVRIDAEPTDAYFVADQIAKYAKENAYDLILAGKETIDYNGSEVGGMIAALLDLPFVSLATHLDVEGDSATLKREIIGGEEVVEVKLPAVISCQKGMAEARIPTMRGIMAARIKPLKAVPAYPSETLTKVVLYILPPQKTGVKLVDAEHPEELVRLLHDEAKVI